MWTNVREEFDEIYALLYKVSKSNPYWLGEASRDTVHKASGLLELDVISALSVQVAFLVNQFNKMAMVLNKQQVQLV